MTNQSIIFTAGYSNITYTPDKEDIGLYMERHRSLNLHELLQNNRVKPYYECDIKYQTEDERTNNYYNDFRLRYKCLESFFKAGENGVKIHCLDASGQCTSSVEPSFKNSFHFIVSGVGSFDSGMDVPYDKSWVIKGEDMFDLNVYKFSEKRQLMRCPVFTPKIISVKDGVVKTENRFLKPIHFNKFTKDIKPLETYRIEDYLVSYVQNEQPNEFPYIVEEYIDYRKENNGDQTRKKVVKRLLGNNDNNGVCQKCKYPHKVYLTCLKALYEQGIENTVSNKYDQYRDWLEVMMMCRNSLKDDDCYNRMSRYFCHINPEKFDDKAEQTIEYLENTDSGFNIPWLHSQLQSNKDCQDEITILNNIYKGFEKQLVIEENVSLGLSDENGKYLNQLKHPENHMSIDELLLACDKYIVDKGGVLKCGICASHILGKNIISMEEFIQKYVITTVHCAFIDGVWILKKKQNEQSGDGFYFELKTGEKFKPIVFKTVSHYHKDNEDTSNCLSYDKNNIKQDCIQDKIKKCSYYSFNPKFTTDFNDNMWFNMFNGLISQQNIRKSRYEHIKNSDDYEPIQIILDHIKDVWANGDENLYDYILQWFKQIVETPHIKTGVVLVLFGEQGTGKGCIMDEFILPFVVGRMNSCSLTGLAEIMGQFNSQIRDKILILVNEVAFDGNEFMTGFDRLKSFITDPFVCINEKNIPRKPNYPNYANMVMTSNQYQSVRIQKGDRRYCCLETSTCKKGNRPYFNKLYSSFTAENGVLFYKYLCQYQKSREIRDIPTTQLKLDIIRLGMSSIHLFIEELVENVDAIMEDPQNQVGWSWELTKCVVKHNDEKRIQPTNLYMLYTAWCMDNNENARKVSQRKFGLEAKSKLEKIKSCGLRYYIIK